MTENAVEVHELDRRTIERAQPGTCAQQFAALALVVDASREIVDLD